MPKIQRALISLTDKTGIVDFVRELMPFGVEIISTGGTAKALHNCVETEFRSFVPAKSKRLGCTRSLRLISASACIVFQFLFCKTKREK